MKQTTGKLKIYFYIVIAMLCWSFSFIWTKIALESFLPLSLITLRLILASLLLFVFLKLTGKLQRIEKKDLKLFFALAFFEPFLYYVGETYGLTLVKPTLASVIVATIPVFAPIFAFIFLKERFTTMIGLIFFIPTALFVDLKKLPEMTIHPKSVEALLMLTVFASVIAFVLFAGVVRKIGITKSQVFTNLIPVFTALFSWILFEEMMNRLQWFGVFIVILGVFVSQSGIKFRKKAT